MTFQERIEQIIEEPLRARGYVVVRVLLTGLKSQHMQIMIERANGESVNLEDCTTVHRIVVALLTHAEGEDAPKRAYTIEISSTGMDRPLVKLHDFERFKGSWIVVHTSFPVDGHKKFKALIHEVVDSNVLLQKEESEEKHLVPFQDIKKAKLFVDFSS